MSDEDDGADWWQHQDNESRRQVEEEAMNRCRVLTKELGDETKEFEREMNELNQRINTNWSDLHGDHG